MILVVDKPVGPTSAAVVHRVGAMLRRAAGVAAKGREQLGHTGTLDPMASGVLVLLGGEARKLAGCLVAEDKVYQATVQLGSETDTEDAQGSPLRTCSTEGVTLAGLRAAARGLTGTIQQVPPMYSALKVAGRRLYDYARAGDEVARTPRAVRIHALEVSSYDPALGQACLRVHCGKGTYVRTLAVELARAVGSGGHLCALRRVAAGGVALARAITLEALQERLAAGLAPPFVAPGELLTRCSRVSLDARLALWIGQGRRLTWGELPPLESPAGGSQDALVVPDEAPPVLAQCADALVALLAPPAGGGGERVRILRGFSPPLPLHDTPWPPGAEGGAPRGGIDESPRM